ncbi:MULTISPECIES: hypothetical protein [unclassified Streptomyces]|uniref:hypothetical protein n=1 Tax=unclassified Streptomyces TaxID=2593676 RepID=UPI002E15D669|nr:MULTISPECIES: hypothetical protein [unclassified Streptomyces]WSJ34765.1 hypothetical protein OG772_00910 [Streptomyces sp. NBC_01321]WSP61207.1 hypothetical protein OG466_04330 [Streptomyces sp. NBC_01240]
MTTTTAAARPRSYFLAGLMQGARGGADLADQGYRDVLRRAILAHRPDAVVHDPGLLMREWIGEHETAILTGHAALAATPEVRRASLDPAVRLLTETFHRLTVLAGDSDVCVAWLPGHEPSMGTAAEMLSAHRAGRTVVAVTGMRQNLAVLSCSDVIVPDLAAFERWLAHEDARVPEPSYP